MPVLTYPLLPLIVKLFPELFFPPLFCFPLFPPGAFPGLQVVVKAAETVLVESISHRLVVELSVFL